MARARSSIRVARVEVSGDKVVRNEICAEGWLQGRSAGGRPVDVEVMSDGSLLAYNDHAGVIYRITYRKP
jgi:glucose/arabinose dehydrogenase